MTDYTSEHTLVDFARQAETADLADFGSETVAAQSTPPAPVTGLEVSDFVTITTARSGLRMTKLWRLVDGKPHCEDYDKAKHFDFDQRPVRNLDDLKNVIDGIGSSSCLIYGRLKDGVNPNGALRRSQDHVENGQAVPATVEDAAHYWLPVDVDSIPAVDDQGEFKPLADPERAVACVLRTMPGEFADADCLWQWTSSAGFKPGIRMRLYFWLNRPLTGAEITAWLKAYPAADSRIYTPNQPIYAAAPQFEGVDNPIQQRSGIRRLRGAVQVPEMLPAVSRREARPAPEGFEPDTPRAIAAAIDVIQDWIARGILPRAGTDGNGNRNSTVQRLAAKLKGIGVSEGTAVELIEDRYLTAAGADAPEEPVEDIVASAFRSAQNPAGSELPQTDEEKYGPPEKWEKILADLNLTQNPISGGTPTQKLGRLHSEDAKQLAVTPRSFIKLTRLTDFFKRPDPVELIRGMMMEGENAAFVGEPKSGKSFLATDIGMSLATGLKVAGYHEVVKSGPVIYLSGEGHAGMKRRLMCWCQDRGLSPEQIANVPFYYNEGVIPATATADDLEAMIGAILEMTGGQPPALVVLDTMSRSLGGLDENAAATASMYLAVIEALRSRLSTTFLSVVHATNKTQGRNAAKELDIRGSSAFSAGFDATWTVAKNDATITLKARWLKEADELGPFCFRLKEVWPVGVLQSKVNATCVLEHVDPATGDNKEKTEERSWRLDVSAKMTELGMIGAIKGKTDREFAEAWHGPPPNAWWTYSQHPAHERKFWLERVVSEAERAELQTWLTKVESTRTKLRNGAAYKNGRNGKTIEAPLHGLFHEGQVRLDGGKAVRLWHLPPGGGEVPF